MEKLIENKDEKSGKCYILNKGVKYWLWSKRGFYVSQIGGKQTMLHRVLYGDGNQENEVYPIDGNFRNLSRNNWKIRKRGAYHYKTDREYKEFDDKKFYKKENGYWWSKTYGSMHRYIWKYYHGSIPKGYQIHHKDGNKDNNTITNLCIMSIGEHLKMHAKNNNWIGSEANKEQLRKANLKRWADYRNRKDQTEKACI